MKEEEKRRPEGDGDERLHISKSVFETSKEMQEKTNEELRLKREEAQKKYELKRKRAAEARDKRLEEERLELLRLKTGVIEESETIREEPEEEIRLTFPQKIGNFLYHNKWWLGIGCVIAFIGGFLVYDHITTPSPDMIVLLIGENTALGEEDGLKEYLSQFTNDNNKNGKKLTSVYYIPYTGVERDDFINSVPQQLSTELQNSDAVVIISNSKLADVITLETNLVDLSELYPGNEHVDKYKFMLSGTDFTEKVGVPEASVPDDWFIAIRKPQDLLYSKKKNMQETYDKDISAFDAIVNDLSE